MKDARILLLDDNREARWPLARVLRAEGARVTEADDGTDGLALLQRSPFDVIVADVCMPRLGGFGLFSQLRFGTGNADAGLPFRHIPIVLITGQVSRAELARGMEAGLDDFISKPVELDEFRARVKAVVQRVRATPKPAARTRGNLADFGMSALAQALHLSCGNGRLCVRSGTAFSALDFHHGQICHAVYAAQGYEVQGEEAAMLVLAHTEGTFEIEPVPSSAPRSVFAETQNILLRAATQADESLTVSHAAARAAAEPQAPVGEPIEVSIDPPSGSVDSASVEFDLDDEPSPTSA